MKKNNIGKTELKITELSFGATSLANMPETYGYEVTEDRAQKTLKRFFQGPVNMLDTSRNYGLGRSEELIGQSIDNNGGWPKDFIFYQQSLIEICKLDTLMQHKQENLLKRVWLP